MKDLIEENYKSIIKRGLINSKTDEKDFILKIEEEVQEFIEAVNYSMKTEPEELADIILVCLNYAKHYNIDIEHELKRKIEINKNR